MRLLLLILLMFEVTANAITKVAVIDTGLDLNDSRFRKVLCHTGHKDFTNEGITDNNGHGTHVAGLIKKYAKNANYCLLVYKIYASFGNNGKREILAIKEAIKNKAKIINISGGGEDFLEKEYQIIKNHKKVTFIVAAGNNGENLDNNKYTFYPASYKLPNIIAVGNKEDTGIPHSSSNYGSFLVWEKGVNVKSTAPNNKMDIMSGSSMATAVFTGKLLHNIYNHSILIFKERKNASNSK